MPEDNARQSRKNGRLHFRMDGGLVERMHAYAKRRGTTLTKMTERLYCQLLEEEERLAALHDAEQI